MSTQMPSERKATSKPVARVDMKLEAVRLPVSNLDRAKSFYAGLGWRVDADFFIAKNQRVLQLTPPGSECSIQFGDGITTAAPGSVQGLMLVVDDIEAARDELVARGVEASEVFHYDGEKGRVTGRDPKGTSYASYVTFADPDGNAWLVQEVRERLPGRVGKGPTLLIDPATLTELLRETEKRHGEFEASSPPKHHWSEWYAAYIVGRERGKTPEEAAAEASSRVRSSHH